VGPIKPKSKQKLCISKQTSLSITSITLAQVEEIVIRLSKATLAQKKLYKYITRVSLEAG
jgi:hypothetical protein